MNSIKISVIIPIYNLERYIERCINSILSNSYQNLEIICINDGSNDKSNEIISRIAHTDNRIVMIDKKNGGVSSARNLGMSIATGDYIAFVDGDDWIHQYYFEVLVNVIKEHDLDIALCSHIQTNVYLEDLPINSDTKYTEMSIENFYLDYASKSFLWGRLYKASLLKNLRFDESVNLGEDVLFNSLLIAQNKHLNIGKIDLALYYYFSRNDSLTKILPAQDIFPLIQKNYVICLDEHNTYFKKLFQIEVIKKSLALRYFSSIKKVNDIKIDTDNTFILSDTIHQLLNNKTATASEKIKYYILYKLPRLYRRIRIMNDKTLLDWEKQS